MASISHPRLMQYAAAVAGMALATGVRLLLDPILDDTHPFLTYYLAIVFIAWACDTGPTLLAILLGSAAATYFFLVPRWTSAIHQVEDQIALGVFVFFGAATMVLSQQVRRARQRLERKQRQLEEEVAQRRLAQEEAQRQAEGLKAVEEALREADRRKDEFLAVLAHELRNPLAPLRNALHVLRQNGPVGETFTRMRDMMERQVRQMTRLVEDLLDVSRIGRGKIKLRRERLDLASVVRNARETSQPLIEAGRHELTVALPEPPVYVTGDPARLAQVLANLLNNAAKYTPDGGHVWLTTRREGDEAVVRVRDNGAGIAAETLPHVFEMFTQSGRLLDRADGGLGIGLTLVRRLVELHGGSVSAHSDGPGAGSEFVVRLPLAPGAPDGRPAEGPESEGDKAPASPARRILVVDDNLDSAESLATLLQFAGHDVRVAHDGPGALKAAKEFLPDVVLLDIGMPGMSGYQVARKLREEPELRHVMLVAQTGWGQEEDRHRAKAAGFDYFLIKPIVPRELHGLIARLAAPPG
jgi:signal transduction histidine kinase/CheY-like chemotaxis protein